MCITCCLIMLLSAGAEDKYEDCPLAVDIALKYKDEIREGRIKEIIKQQKSEVLVKDLRIYANNFTKWSLSKLSVINETDDYQYNKELTQEEIRKQKTKQFKKEWYQGTEPIQRNGSIIVAEIQEIASRYETNAIPYLRRIAETKLPKELGVPTCARIKGHYQNPAAEAWLKLTMPKDMSVADAKLWLTNFITEEKAKGATKKDWTIEAAERRLRKVEEEGVKSPAKQ